MTIIQWKLHLSGIQFAQCNQPILGELIVIKINSTHQIH